MKKPLFSKCLFVLLALFWGVASAQAGNVFEVQKIKVDASAASTSLARAAALRQAGDGQRQRWLDAQHGQTLSVLVEKQGDVKSEGRSGNFARVQLPPKFSAGELVSLRVSGHDGLMLSGDVL